MRTQRVFPVAVGLLMTACATVPAGPSVMVLPGNGKNFEQFQADDAVCRQWAAQQTGTTTKRATTETAVGAGAGLLGGAAVGGSNAQAAGTQVQHRYDMTYMQCMYAKGNQIPMARGSIPSTYVGQPAASPPPPPPPPPGAPPPPPPGPMR